VLLRIFHQVGQPRHGAVFPHDLADHRRRVEAGQPGDVAACPDNKNAIIQAAR